MEGRKQPEFIIKLIDMMQKYPQYITWTESGREVIIKDLKQFAEIVIPAYFKHSKFTSLSRQFNMYGFSKKQMVGDSLIYQHPLFYRTNQSNFQKIQRKSKSNRLIQKIQINDEILMGIRSAENIPEQIKDNIEQMLLFKKQLEAIMKQVKKDLVSLTDQLKDARSKEVLETMQHIKQSYKSLIVSLSKAKQIEQFTNSKFINDQMIHEDQQDQISFQAGLQENSLSDFQEQIEMDNPEKQDFYHELLKSQLGLHGNQNDFNL